MKMVYKWSEGTRLNADAQKVGERLEKLKDKNQGVLDPQSVVDDARPEKSVLHPCFEWDDAVAANEHRKSQARYIIRHIKVEYVNPVTKSDIPIRAYVSLQDEGEAKPKYVGTMDAMQDKRQRRMLLQKAWTELQSWKNRYLDFKELGMVFEAIDQIEAQMLQDDDLKVTA